MLMGEVGSAEFQREDSEFQSRGLDLKLYILVDLGVSLSRRSLFPAHRFMEEYLLGDCPR